MTVAQMSVAVEGGKVVAGPNVPSTVGPVTSPTDFVMNCYHVTSVSSSQNGNLAK